MKHSIRAISIIALFIMHYGVTMAQRGDMILGVYRVVGEETKKASNIKFYRKGNTYEAQIIWYESPHDKQGKLLLDMLNPNPKLRSVPVDKIVVIKGLKYDSKDNKWVDGSIYNPAVGKIYNVMAEFDSPTKLKIRGYLGTPTLGKNFIWTKIK